MAGTSTDGRQFERGNGRNAIDAAAPSRPSIVTTSWDDGHKYDRRLADLLHSHGLPGTFYVSPFTREFDNRDLLTKKDVCEIAAHFEIGSHTLTHPVLPEISAKDATSEISTSKTLLEDVTGRSVTSFCYPRGAYLPEHREMVKEAGYLYARTVARYAFDLSNPYDAPTSIHAYNHWTDLWRMAKFSGFNVVDILSYRQWDHLSNAMFDRVMAAGGIFHLWGHSWEIDARDDWQRLERALSYLSGRPGVIYLTNGELLTSMLRLRKPTQQLLNQTEE